MTSTSNENSTKAMMMKRDSLLADDLDNFDPSDLDLEEDEWRDVFDNVAPPENADPSESSESLLMPPPADKKKEGAMSGCTESPGLLGESKRRKRTAAQLEREDKTAQAPPTWHSTEADLQHRQTMVQDM